MMTQALSFNQQHWRSIHDTPYQLCTPLQPADTFYMVLETLTEKVLENGHSWLGVFVKRYRCSVAYLKNDFTQSPDETVLDLLIMGVLWNQYKGRWKNSAIVVKEKVLNQLYTARMKAPHFKPVVDSVRGKLATAFLDQPQTGNAEISLQNFTLLSKWLSATNEFNEEVIRIDSWLEFLAKLPERAARLFLMDVCAFAAWFKLEASKSLGTYTKRVESFLSTQKYKYRGKENYFFTGRSEVEYHLNMVGAAIMNESLKKEFQETEFQVLLLPSCMAKSKNCQKVEAMHGTICQHCTKGCNISNASREMMDKGVHTFIVSHSSSFSKSLERWSNQKRIGLIGTACVLNLLKGGFEMKRLNIPAQCVFLDYSGCSKHWTELGIPTSVCLSKVSSLVEVERSKAV